jgi:hypothetical protein
MMELFAALRESVAVKVFGCRPCVDGAVRRGPASENLQGRKPRDGTRGGAAGAMEIWLPRMTWVIDGEPPRRVG